MRKILKSLFLVLSLSCFVLIGLVTTKAANTLADTIDVQLEQQENKTNNKIRYVATMSNVEDLANIVDIEITFTLSKEGETSRTAKRTITSVYTSIAGTNGKPEVDNTYYAVYTLTDTNGYPGYSLTTTFKFNYSDNSYEDSNTINYSIATDYTVASYGTGSFEQSGSIEDLFTASSIENGHIFHAWNWSMTTIEANLDDIKAAGFTTVQTSPMQPQKDYYAGNAQSDWWKFYQPLGFVVAPDGVNNALGTKSELTHMVTTAHSKGMKVIVDVVANHLAGSYNELSSGVAAYEPTIYGSNGTLSGGALLHSVGASGTAAQDSSHTTDGHIYLPDLDTGKSHVQQRVLSLLKEYIDCGVDGFRFDAAKHIETDNASEPNGSSQFWPTVINGATSYAQEKGKDKPYYYGEILYGCGSGRSYSWYTKYMDVIDNTTGNNITETFNGGNATSTSTYNTGCTADQVVVWAESHDTYANESHDSTFIDQAVIDKSYAYSAARGKAQALYLARPCADNQFGNVGSDGKLKITCPVLLGAKGNWDAFKSAQITAVNKFHNYWENEAEWIHQSGTFSEVVRYKDNESGMVLINANSSTSVSNVEVPTVMKDGSYNDLVTGNVFTVSDGKVSGTMHSSGIAVLVDPNAGTGGSISITSTAPATFSTDTMAAIYKIKNAESATMTIGSDTFAITSGAEITFGSTMAIGDTFTVSITAGDVTKSFTYTKVEAPHTVKAYFEKPTGFGTPYAYIWNSTTNDKNAAWPGEAMTFDSTTGKYSIEYLSDTYDNIIFTDGSNKTDDLDLVADANYVATEAEYIGFEKPTTWSTVNAYLWGGTNSTATAWPGISMTYDSGTGLYFVPKGDYTSVIFNNGNDGNNNQTVDIDIDNYVFYYVLAGSTNSAGKQTVNKVYNVSMDNLCDTHTYGEPNWNWTDYSEARAWFSCSVCNHYEVIVASVTSEVTVQPTTTTTGTRVYTATVTFEGHTYTTTKTEELPMVGVTHVAAVAATCTTSGNIEYWMDDATGKYYSDSALTTEITLAQTIVAATGHSYCAGVYSAATGVTCDTCGEVVTPTIDTSKVYYLVNSTWGDDWNTRSNIYYYTGAAQMSWPGIQMTKEGTVTYKGITYTVYSYTFASGKLTDYAKVIFSSGTSGNAQNSEGTDVLSGVNCYINDYDDNFEATEFIYIPEGN